MSASANSTPERCATGTASVVICTYSARRWPDLVRACEAVLRQTADDDELIIVVDHNPELLERARDTLPGARVVACQGSPGLSSARNTGIRASERDIVVFLDDDAEPRPGWLAAMRKAFVDRSVLVVGTGVAPRWEGGRAPRWFPEEFGWVVGCGYRGLPTERSTVRNPIGASMAIRRELFAKVGGFLEAVGRIGRLPAGCEETEFCIRASDRTAGGRVVYDPAGVVDHYVPTERQTVRYFVRRCYYEGRSKRVVTRLRGAQAALSAERRYVRRTLPMAIWRGVAGAARQPHGLLQAGATMTGLAATAFGYLLAVRRPAVEASAASVALLPDSLTRH